MSYSKPYTTPEIAMMCALSALRRTAISGSRLAGRARVSELCLRLRLVSLLFAGQG